MDKKYYLKINASEIASCIGKNQYISQDIMILKLWRKQDPVSFEKALLRNNLYIHDLSKTKNKKYIEKVKNMDNGIQNEKNVIEEFQKKCNVAVKDNNKKRYTLFITKPQNGIIIHNIIIAGYVDGIVENNNEKYIIEIKNRQNKLFKYIPEHEKIQLITYMKITNIHECSHIEKYNNDMNIIKLEYEDILWSKIQTDLLKFIDYFEKVYFNHIFQDIFLKEKIINNEKNGKMLSSNLNYNIKTNVIV
jgi:hypothetical protein